MSDPDDIAARYAEVVQEIWRILGDIGEREGTGLQDGMRDWFNSQSRMTDSAIECQLRPDFDWRKI